MPPLKLRTEAVVTFRLPKTSLTPLARWIVPPESVTAEVLATWLFCEMSKVAPVPTLTLPAIALTPAVLFRFSTPPLIVVAPL